MALTMRKPKEDIVPATLDTALQNTFRQAEREIDASLIERGAEVRMLLTGLVAGVNPLLVGPPGTAKSMLCDGICAFVQGNLFTTLINKFTPPDEIFGPPSLTKLQLDQYERVTRGRLPEAHIAFLDEIFKGSTAILNTLLRVMNEGIFENNGVLVKVPTLMIVSASNEWPQGDELAALFDRFLLRRIVRPIATSKGLDRLLWERDRSFKLSARVTPSQVLQARAEAKTIPFTAKAKQDMLRILAKIQQEGIIVGDRRKDKAITVVQAYAYLEGANVVQSEHLEVLSDVLWSDPAEQPAKVAEIVMRIANPLGVQVAQRIKEAEEIISTASGDDLDRANAAVKKLKEIQIQLSTMKETERVKAAMAFVGDGITEISLRAIQSVT